MYKSPYTKNINEDSGNDLHEGKFRGLKLTLNETKSGVTQINFLKTKAHAGPTSSQENLRYELEHNWIHSINLAYHHSVWSDDLL